MEYYYLIDLKRRILTQNRVTSHTHRRRKN